jgi:hypothetical protein
MSRTWKIAIGVVAVFAVVVVAGLGWFVLSRGWIPGAFAQRGAGTTQLAVKLIDDNEDSIPDRGVIDFPAFGRGLGPGRDGRFNQRRGAETAQLNVRLVDDDGDGVPDRGVIDQRVGSAFGLTGAFRRGIGPGRGSYFGRRIGPGFGLPFRSFFGPFFILGWLVRLAVLALLVGLVLLFVRHWRSSPPSAPASTQPEDSA